MYLYMDVCSLDEMQRVISSQSICMKYATFSISRLPSRIPNQPLHFILYIFSGPSINLYINTTRSPCHTRTRRLTMIRKVFCRKINNRRRQSDRIERKKSVMLYGAANERHQRRQQQRQARLKGIQNNNNKMWCGARKMPNSSFICCHCWLAATLALCIIHIYIYIYIQPPGPTSFCAQSATYSEGQPLEFLMVHGSQRCVLFMCMYKHRFFSATLLMSPASCLIYGDDNADKELVLHSNI